MHGGARRNAEQNNAESKIGHVAGRVVHSLCCRGNEWQGTGVTGEPWTGLVCGREF